MSNEVSRGRDSAVLTVEAPVHDHIRWLASFKVEKYEEDIAALRQERYGIYVPDRTLWTPEFEEKLGLIDADLLKRLKPYEVIEGEGNILVNAGINLVWNLVAGAGGTAFSNANAHLGVGDSTTAAAASQTDLQAATNKLRKGMEATFPVTGSNQKIQLKSSFGTSEANFAWNEWASFNASSAGTMLNRKVESLGTKSTGTWNLTVDVTLA